MSGSDLFDGEPIKHRLSRYSYLSRMDEAVALCAGGQYLNALTSLLRAMWYIYNQTELEEFVKNIEMLLSAIPFEKQAEAREQLRAANVLSFIKRWSVEKKSVPLLVAILGPEADKALNAAATLRVTLSANTQRNNDRILQNTINQLIDRIFEALTRHLIADLSAIMQAIMINAGQIRDPKNVEDLSYWSETELNQFNQIFIDWKRQYQTNRENRIRSIIEAALASVKRKYPLNPSDEVIKSKITVKLASCWGYFNEQDITEMPPLLAQIIINNLVPTNFLTNLFFTKIYYIGNELNFELALAKLIKDKFSGRQPIPINLNIFQRESNKPINNSAPSALV